MTTYYNENDPFAAAWLRNLMKEGLIYDGEIDERSIADVRAADLRGFTACHFFAGIGGWDLALDRARWPAERKVWTGSCPCQPFSLAGRQRGFDDERHLWPIWRSLIAECRPPTIFGEQVASASAWLGLVRGDLEALAYTVGAIPVEAASAGAYHLRDRYWFVADRECGAGGRRPDQPQRQAQGRTAVDRHGEIDDPRWVAGVDGKARRVEPGIRLLAHGVPNRVGLLRGFGNAIDPRPAQAFIEAFLTS
jgi:DNA (cytosine-5)-methyltransferase 1